LIDISMAVAKSSAVTRRVSVHDNRVRDAEKREEVHKHGDPDDAAANRKQTGAKTGSAGVDAEAKILGRAHRFARFVEPTVIARPVPGFSRTLRARQDGRSPLELNVIHAPRTLAVECEAVGDRDE
jgi:hypothetical protein